MRGVLAFTQLAWGLRESKRLSCRGHFLGQAPTSSQKHRQAVTGSDKLPQALAGFDKLPQAPTSSDKLRLPQAPTSSDKLSKAPTNSHGLSDKLPQAPTNSHSLRQALTSSDQLPQVPASSHMLRQAQAPTSSYPTTSSKAPTSMLQFSHQLGRPRISGKNQASTPREFHFARSCRDSPGKLRSNEKNLRLTPYKEACSEDRVCY